MHGEIIAYVEPKILVWARTRLSATIEVVSEKTGIKAEQIKDWENGNSNPSFAKLKKLADFYRLNYSAFFLSEPPQKKSKSSINLRRFYNIFSLDFDIIAQRFLVESIEKRDILLELLDDSYKNKVSGIIESDSEILTATSKIKRILKIPWNGSKKTSREWFNIIRDRIEKLGVIIFQTNRYVDFGNIRGIAVNEKTLPMIILNKADSYSARSFTMIHELVHLMCNHDDVFQSNNDYELNNIETWVNKVSSNVLVDEAFFWEIFHKRSDLVDDDYLMCDDISHYFGVSAEVIARKLLDSNLFSIDRYNYVRNEGISKSKLKGKTGRTMPHYTCVNENGKLFVKSILHKYSDGFFTIPEASSLLGLTHKSFYKLINFIQ